MTGSGPDAEWTDAAADLMHRTGIAPRGHEAARQWTGVRHNGESIHAVAALASRRRHHRVWRASAPADDWPQL